MNTYILYNKKTGQLIQVMKNCNLEDILHMLSEDVGAKLATDLPENSDYYIQDNSIVTIPPQPSSNHIWDPGSKQWELSKGLMLLKIKQLQQRLLRESDWIIIRALDQGVPIPKDWQTYRQKLRDIDAQPGYPNTIEWPIKPV
jgi:hypothetical protein